MLILLLASSFLRTILVMIFLSPFVVDFIRRGRISSSRATHRPNLTRIVVLLVVILSPAAADGPPSYPDPSFRYWLSPPCPTTCCLFGGDISGGSPAVAAVSNATFGGVGFSSSFSYSRTTMARLAASSPFFSSYFHRFPLVIVTAAPVIVKLIRQ